MILRNFAVRFRTPSLRNVAVRKSYMHNGAFSSLRDVVAFYASRSTNPRRWYGTQEFDDLPKQYRENVNVDKTPYNRHAGEAPDARRERDRRHRCVLRYAQRHHTALKFATGVRSQLCHAYRASTQRATNGFEHAALESHELSIEDALNSTNTYQVCSRSNMARSREISHHANPFVTVALELCRDHYGVQLHAFGQRGNL